MRILIAFSLLFLCSPAMAAWDYAKWGMRAEQIVASSKGKARLPTPADKNIPIAPLKTIAIANDEFEGIPVVIVFLEWGGRFVSVDFAPISTRKCSKFLAALERVHGPKTPDDAGSTYSREYAWFWKLKTGEKLVLALNRVTPFPTGRACVASLTERR